MQAPRRQRNGVETARIFASRGASLVLPARSLKAAEEIKANIVSEFPDSTGVVMPLDLNSLAFKQHREVLPWPPDFRGWSGDEVCLELLRAFPVDEVVDAEDGGDDRGEWYSIGSLMFLKMR